MKLGKPGRAPLGTANTNDLRAMCVRTTFVSEHGDQSWRVEVAKLRQFQTLNPCAWTSNVWA